MSNKRKQRLNAIKQKFGVSNRAAANILAVSASGSPPVPPSPRPPRVTMREQWDAMNHTAMRVAFVSGEVFRGTGEAYFIQYDGRRVPGSQSVTLFEEVVDDAKKSERRFFEVVSTARKLLANTWEQMKRDPAFKATWIRRWTAAANLFASETERWGEGADRFWNHVGEDT
jgi:hypothetical protein